MGKDSNSSLFIAAIGQGRPTGIPFLLKGGKIKCPTAGRQQDAVVEVEGKEVYQFIASPPIEEMGVGDLNDIVVGVLGRDSHLPERLKDPVQDQVLRGAIRDVQGGVGPGESKFGFIKGGFDNAKRTLTLFLTEKEVVGTQ